MKIHTSINFAPQMQMTKTQNNRHQCRPETPFAVIYFGQRAPCASVAEANWRTTGLVDNSGAHALRC